MITACERKFSNRAIGSASFQTLPDAHHQRIIKKFTREKTCTESREALSLNKNKNSQVKLTMTCL
uniref:Uncharacterized protein n=1 Tax=Physcomitrium patens TaxID=3218 RepID=A0A2K1IRL3_PHYPA|nr:hypothetical protein PHYPA_026040 [Physcomitrium patens]